MLTAEEKQRYDRQMMIAGIGEAGQEKLKNARVVIAGTGDWVHQFLSTWPRPAWGRCALSIMTGWNLAI